MNITTKKSLTQEQERITMELESEQDPEVRKQLLEELDRIEGTLNRRDTNIKILGATLPIVGTILSTIISVVAYNGWIRQGYEFEKSGMITSSNTFRDVRHMTTPKTKI